MKLVTYRDESDKQRFTNGGPSATWIKSIRQKHRMAIRFARPIFQENYRVLAVNGDSLASHFATLKKIIKDNRITVNRLFNGEEMGMSPDRDFSKGLRQRCFLPRRGRYATSDHCLVQFANKYHLKCMQAVFASG